jgi:hypothetical protein
MENLSLVDTFFQFVNSAITAAIPAHLYYIWVQEHVITRLHYFVFCCYAVSFFASVFNLINANTSFGPTDSMVFLYNLFDISVVVVFVITDLEALKQFKPIIPFLKNRLILTCQIVFVAIFLLLQGPGYMKGILFPNFKSNHFLARVFNDSCSGTSMPPRTSLAYAQFTFSYEQYGLLSDLDI